jgi:hypothetical protein
VLGPGASIDEARVPEYYRHNIPVISAWFLLDSVDDYPISADVHKLSHAHREYSTAVRCNGHPFTDSYTLYKGCKKINFIYFIRFALWLGLRFLIPRQVPEIGGRQHTLAECRKLDLDRIGLKNQIGAMLITGDFTTKGDWSDKTKHHILDEFSTLSRELDIDKNSILCLPGAIRT